MRSIGVRLVIAFLIVVAVSVTIPSYYSISYLFSHIYREAQLKTESDLEVATLLFNQKKQKMLLPARVLSKDISFNRILAGRMGDMIKVRVKYFVRGLSEDDLTYMTVTDRQGNVLFRSQAAYSTGDNISDETAIAMALKGEEVTTYRCVDADEMWRNGLLAEPPLGSSSEEGLVVEAVVPVFALSELNEVGAYRPPDWGSEVVGVISVGYLLNRDKTLLSMIQERTRGVASIYIPGGLVNTSDPEWSGVIADSFFDVVDANGGDQYVHDYRDRGEIAGYFPLKDINGRQMALFELRNSTSDIENAKRRSLRDNFFFILIGVVFASVLGLILTRKMTDPIMRLRRGAEEIGRGNLLYRIEIQGTDEVSQLSRAFNNMSIQLNRSMEEMRIGKQQIEEYSQRLRSAHTSLEMYSKELEKVNQELLTSNINLQKANEVKDTFLSTVSHELKTPLTSIIGYVSMILEGALGGVPREQKESLEVVLRRGKDLQSLISDLLSLSRIDAGKIELRKSYIDLLQEIRGLEEVFSERLKELGLRLEIETTESVPRVYADRDRINQVIFNLVGNAIKFTREGGVIKVSAVHRQPENDIMVSVTDSGIGISEQELGHVFERFYQVDKHEGREYGGTGLGLSIAKDLVELHEGKIWVESSLGEGSTFTFTLPLKQV
ncbi:MAG TPA: ATP-binding protein [bacterium]|nr:ATP-binding protein [bacterium]